MAKQMVIDGVVYVEKEAYDKEITDLKSKEFLKINTESIRKAMSEMNHHTFIDVVRKSAKSQMNIFNNGYFDSDIIDEKEDYDGKRIHQKLLMIALASQE